jgi:hypothetical protein
MSAPRVEWLFGGLLPWIGFNLWPLNRDGSIVDTGEPCVDDERGPLYVRVLTFEWLGQAWEFDAPVRDSRTGEIVFPKWADLAGYPPE